MNIELIKVFAEQMFLYINQYKKADALNFVQSTIGSMAKNDKLMLMQASVAVLMKELLGQTMVNEAVYNKDGTISTLLEQLMAGMDENAREIVDVIENEKSNKQMSFEEDEDYTYQTVTEINEDKIKRGHAFQLLLSILEMEHSEKAIKYIPGQDLEKMVLDMLKPNITQEMAREEKGLMPIENDFELIRMGLLLSLIKGDDSKQRFWKGVASKWLQKEINQYGTDIFKVRNNLSYSLGGVIDILSFLPQHQIPKELPWLSIKLMECMEVFVEKTGKDIFYYGVHQVAELLNVLVKKDVLNNQKICDFFETVSGEMPYYICQNKDSDAMIVNMRRANFLVELKKQLVKLDEDGSNVVDKLGIRHCLNDFKNGPMTILKFEGLVDLIKENFPVSSIENNASGDAAFGKIKKVVIEWDTRYGKEKMDLAKNYVTKVMLLIAQGNSESYVEEAIIALGSDFEMRGELGEIKVNDNKKQLKF